MPSPATPSPPCRSIEKTAVGVGESSLASANQPQDGGGAFNEGRSVAGRSRLQRGVPAAARPIRAAWSSHGLAELGAPGGSRLLQRVWGGLSLSRPLQQGLISPRTRLPGSAMTTSGAAMGCERCQCHSEDKRTAILYTLLSQNLAQGRGSRSPAQQRCLCRQRLTVCLRTPHVTCPAASKVLVKTIRFMKNLPCFHLLPREDQLLLLGGCWVPLFLLGLVQEMVTFEVMETPAPSMLKKILLDGQSQQWEPEGTQPTLAAVQRLQCCLSAFWSLDLSPQEYAYLKGAVLFNPGECPAPRRPPHPSAVPRRSGRAQPTPGGLSLGWETCRCRQRGGPVPSPPNARGSGMSHGAVEARLLPGTPGVALCPRVCPVCHSSPLKRQPWKSHISLALRPPRRRGLGDAP